MAELVAAAYVRGADVTETIATLSTAHITAPRSSSARMLVLISGKNDAVFSHEDIAKFLHF